MQGPRQIILQRKIRLIRSYLKKIQEAIRIECRMWRSNFYDTERRWEREKNEKSK